MSRETTSSWTSLGPSGRPAQIPCRNDDHSISPRQSVLAGPLSCSDLPTAQTNESQVQPTSKGPKSSIENFTEATNCSSNIAKPQSQTPPSAAQDLDDAANTSAKSNVARSKRIRLFTKAVQGFGRLVLRIDVRVTSLPRNPAAVETPGQKVPSDGSLTEPSFKRRRTVDRAEGNPRNEEHSKHEDLNQVQDRPSEDSRIKKSVRIEESDAQPPDEEAEIDRRKNDPVRLQRIDTLRKAATRNAVARGCYCSSTCACRNSSQRLQSIVDSTHSDTTPSLVPSSRTTSLSTNDSTTSRQPIADVLHRVGAHVSSSSIHSVVRGRRRLSRPSRLNSVVAVSEGVNSRPGSSGLANRSMNASSIPEVGAEQSRALQHRQEPSTRSMQPMVLMEDGRGLTEEPDRMPAAFEGPVTSLRLSTQRLRPSSAHETRREGSNNVNVDNSESMADGEMTPTQSQVDAGSASSLDAAMRDVSSHHNNP